MFSKIGRIDLSQIFAEKRYLKMYSKIRKLNLARRNRMQDSIDLGMW